jgi:hypothetical protein
VYLLSLAVGGWLLFLQLVLLRFVRHGWFSNPTAAMFSALTIYTAVTLFFYNAFIVEERDQKIFDKHINSWNDNPNKKRDLFVTSFVAVAPYLFMVCIKLILRR